MLSSCVVKRWFWLYFSNLCQAVWPFIRSIHSLVVCSLCTAFINNNNNNNQYIYKQRQSHAMSQRRWLATAVIFRPSDMCLGFAETWTVIAPATAQTLEGGSRALVRRWRKPVDQWLSETAAPIGHWQYAFIFLFYSFCIFFSVHCTLCIFVFYNCCLVRINKWMDGWIIYWKRIYRFWWQLAQVAHGAKAWNNQLGGQ